MSRILLAIAAPAVTLLVASCCCTSDTKPPGLRPMPTFSEVPAAPAPAPAPVRVHHGK